MPLKYQHELRERPDQPCPCLKAHVPRERKAYRFMHNQATEAVDFEPPAITDGGVKKRDRCGRLALSFFESVKAARDRWPALAEREDAELRYGGHIGEIDLRKEDGLMSNPSKSGHINLHQDRDARFAHRVIRYYGVTEEAPPPAKTRGENHAA